MTSKLWALIKWIGGEDDKKYTAGIPVEWIKGFDIEEFRSDNFDPTLSYVIEWHSQKKPPPGGWPLYDGYVIEISNRLSVLEKKVKAIDGIISPTKTVDSQADEQQNIDNNGGSMINNNITQNMSHTIRMDEVASGSGKNKPPKRNAVYQKQDVLSKDSNNHNDEDSTDSDEIITNHSDMSGVVRISKKKPRMQLYKPVKEHNDEVNLAQTLRGIQGELKRLRKKKHSRNRGSDTSDSSDDEMKEIGRRGSGIFIPEERWQVAKRAQSYTAMGINLLLALFPMEDLLRSNLRGGKSKDPTRNAIQRTALDKDTIDALYYSVRRQWKNAFNYAGLGIALNSKLTRLRTEQKKNQQATNSE